jgi:ribose/xylose/arabinose/galactoside ABC-type transport system permease subunit
MEVAQRSHTPEANWAERIEKWFQSWGTVLVALVLFVIFSLTAEYFFTLQNFQNILRQVAIVAVVAIGMTMVILIGGIDLSVGAVVLSSAAVMNSLLFNEVVPAVPAIIIGLLAAALVGFINGLLIVKAKISPIIVTLGTMVMIRGLGQMILWINNSWLWVRHPIFTYIKTETIGSIPVPAVMMFILYIFAAIMMTKTRFGRHIYAIGGNERAAHLCGIPVNRTKILVYVFTGFISGIAGIMMSARLSAISPGVGLGLEFEVITAVILGGTSLAGGVGKVEKTLLGAIIVAAILNYMTIKGISAHYQRAVTGFIILAAATLDQLSRGRTSS